MKLSKPSETARIAMARAMTEDELLNAIAEAATLLGWRWTHTRRSDKALTMGNLGVPDLTLAKEGRTLFLELKREGGRLTEDQWAWLLAIDPGNRTGYQVEGLGGKLDQRVTALVVYPEDLDDLLALLVSGIQ